MNAKPKSNGRPISVCFLIGSLEFGGAERQVVELVRSFHPDHVKPFICSLSREVPLADYLPRKSEQLVVAEKRGRFDLTTVFRVAQILRQRRCDVVHAFLFDAEIAARLAARLAGTPAVIASERNAEYARPLLHHMALKLTQPLFTLMIANSHAGKAFNIRTLGLRASRIEVVHNGVDTERFYPDPEAGLAFRRKLGIPPHSPVVGMVGSFKRQKGQDSFVRMAARLAQALPDASFLIVGEPMRDDAEDGGRYAAEVKQLAAALNLADRCHFLGNQKEVRAVYNACDMTALLSRREGTPNVILESMACGIPVVSSDIADNRLIILDGVTGYVAPVDAPEAAAMRARWILCAPGERNRMGKAARSRICEKFSLPVAAGKLQAIYERCLSGKRPSLAPLSAAPENTWPLAFAGAPSAPARASRCGQLPPAR